MLLERDDDLRAMDEALASCRDGRGGVVLISGEAGSGKTSLIQSFCTKLAPDIRLLLGAAEQLFTPQALGPFKEMLRAMGSVDDRDDVIATIAEMTAPSAPRVVLVVDDAHWADEASLDVIRYLGRRIESIGLLLIVAFRPDEPADQGLLRQVLGGLVGPSVSRIEVRGLSDAAVAQLADEAGVDRARVLGLGGNPFLVTEVLAARDADVPATVRDVVLGRVVGLAPASRDVLDVLAVVPRSVSLELLESVIPRAAFNLADPERAGLVRITGESVAFRHDLVGDVIESAMPEAQRVHWNRVLLAALSERGADASLLLHHAVAAADTSAVARHAPAAARGALRSESYREATAASRAALRHPDLLSDRVVAEMHETAARALYATNHFDAANVHAERSEATWRRVGESPIEVADAALLAARLQTMLGRPADSRAAVERAIASLAPVGVCAGLARAHELLANIDAIAGDHDDSIAHGHRAIEFADELQDPSIALRVSVHVGVALAGRGDPGGQQMLEEACAELAGLDEPEYEARAWSALAVVLSWEGRHVEALPLFRHVERISRDRGVDFVLFHAVAQIAMIDILFGRWEQAERALRDLLAESTDAAALRVLPMAYLGRLLARQGSEEAVPLIEAASQDALASGQIRRIAPAAAAKIELAWLSGDDDVAAHEADELLRLGRRANMRFASGEALRWLRRCGHEVTAVTGIEAQVAGVQGEWQSAALAWERWGNPYEEALELVEAPDAVIAGRGLRILDGLGARATVDAVRMRRRRRGAEAGSRARAERGPHGLTRRQREILDLVADGMTSPEIAERLFLSRRTVDNHVAAALDQLGVNSRREAARQIRPGASARAGSTRRPGTSAGPPQGAARRSPSDTH